MRYLVIGLEGAAPELLFGDEHLETIRYLMQVGSYGALEGVTPACSVPGWLCLATGQDPGALGVYGAQRRVDYSNSAQQLADASAVDECVIWDELARAGQGSVILGVPLSYPPLSLNGVGGTPSLIPSGPEPYIYPQELRAEIGRLAGHYPLDVPVNGGPPERFRDEVYATTRQHFEAARHVLRTREWEHFQFVEIGVDRMQRRFWKYQDPESPEYEPNNPYREVIRDYYRYLDREIAATLELIDDETVVLVASTHGTQRLLGGFHVNEWLVREGLLVLDEYPNRPTRFSELKVNWERTRVWSYGGCCARLFFNLAGRDPAGVLDQAGADALVPELREKLQGLTDETGWSPRARIFRPAEIYREIRGVAPDLIVYFDDLRLRALGRVGYRSLHLAADDLGDTGCSHGTMGSFILAAPGSPLQGEICGAKLLDLAPTLLELGGHRVPISMSGRSLVAESSILSDGLSADEEEIIRERLRGLGYIE